MPETEETMRTPIAALALLCLAAAGCSTESYVSPNDPNYARSGAPRAGEPSLQPGNLYNRVQGHDNSGSE
jgi:hypothetical protein